MTLPVAVVQAAPVAFDVPATLERMESALQECPGARLVVFPEAFLGGYPKGLDFGAKVGTRTPEGRAMFSRYYEAAIEIPSSQTEAVGELARSFETHLVVGAIERDAGTLYCVAMIFGPDGRLLSARRKLVPTAVERIVWGAGDGSTLDVVDTPLGKIGAVICWENYMPMLRMAMYGQGIQLYCAPTVDDRDSWIPSMQHIATEGRCFVLSSCPFACRRDYPADYPSAYGDDPDTVLIRGGSCIVDPFGSILAGPVYGHSGVLRAELDLGAIVRGKYDLDVVGHYARPDVFRLEVDRTPRAAVSHRRDGVN